MKDNFVWGAISDEALLRKQKEVIKQLLVNIAYYQKNEVKKFELICADNSCKKCNDRAGIYKGEEIRDIILSIHKDCEYEYCRCCIIPVLP